MPWRVCELGCRHERQISMNREEGKRMQYAVGRTLEGVLVMLRRQEGEQRAEWAGFRGLNTCLTGGEANDARTHAFRPQGWRSTRQTTPVENKSGRG